MAIPAGRTVDDAAWIEAWVRDWGDRITQFAYTYADDAGLAQDAAQETFLRLFRWGAAHPNETVTAGWLFTTARNVTIDLLRHRREVVTDEPDPGETRPERSLDLATRIAVRDALDALPTADRECLWLFYYGGFSVAGIAAELHLTASGVKARLMRARHRFARLWEGEGDD